MKPSLLKKEEGEDEDEGKNEHHFNEDDNGKNGVTDRSNTCSQSSNTKNTNNNHERIKIKKEEEKEEIFKNEDNDNSNNGHINNKHEDIDSYDSYADWKKGNWCWLLPLPAARKKNTKNNIAIPMKAVSATTAATVSSVHIDSNNTTDIKTKMTATAK